MKVLSIAVLFVSFNLFSAPASVICRDDQRMDKGSLREWVLTDSGSGYGLKSQYVQSLQATEIDAKSWAENLSCKLDEKAALVFCQNQGGQVVRFKDKRETFLDSLEGDKKKTIRYTEISLIEDGVVTKTETFNASHCQVFGGEK